MWRVDSNRSSSVLIRRRNELHIRSEFSIIKVLEDPDKSGFAEVNHFEKRNKDYILYWGIRVCYLSIVLNAVTK